MKKFKNKLSLFMKEHTMKLLIILAFLIIMPFISNSFLKMNNFMNILQNISLQGITAIGMTMVIILGGIDISVGGVLALAVWVAAYLMTKGYSFILAIIVAILIGMICGFINGFSIGVLNIPPMIATLAMMNITRGLQTVISKGSTLNGFPKEFNFIGQGKIIGIPVAAIIIALLYVFAHWFMTKTVTGREIFAVGGNREASRISGINNKKIIFFTYMSCSVFAVIAGLLFIARMDSAPASIGNQLDMRTIMAVVIGGTAITHGGKGSMVGTFLGVIIVGLITNALDLAGVSVYYQQFIQGTLVLLVVTLESIKEMREKQNE